MHSRLEPPSTALTNLLPKLPLPPLPRKREASTEPADSSQAEKTLRVSEETVQNDSPAAQPGNVVESTTDMHIDGSGEVRV